MKKALTAIALVLFAATLPSQALAKDPKAQQESKPLEASEHAQLALLRASIRIDKRDFIKDAMGLTPEEGKKFWSIYHQYEADLMKLNDERQDVIEDYAKNYEKISEAKADELVKKSIEYHKARTSLLEKYYGKVAKAISKRAGARFLQVENVLQGAGDVTIGTSIPFGAVSRLPGFRPSPHRPTTTTL